MAGDSLPGHGRSVDVVVVGSANLDLIARVAHAPLPGETVIATEFGEHPGGKGLNQAVAAADVASTALVARVGDDESGRALRAYAAARGVDVGAVEPTVAAPTGRAMITLHPDGENTIVVAPLANMTLTPADARAALERIDAAVALVQFEIPAEVVAAVADWSVATGKRLVVNPSPIRDVSTALLARADPLVLNAGEASDILRAQGIEISPADPAALALALSVRCRSVVVTAGAGGAFAAMDGAVTAVPTLPVEVQDSSGAGDAFAGVLCARLARDGDVVSATRDAVAEAARVVASPRSRR